jgi:hypothetical protein
MTEGDFHVSENVNRKSKSREDKLHEAVVTTIASFKPLHLPRPKLKPKLLAKPPFRYLHEIVKNVILSTGFAPGLFNEKDELDCATITTKTQRVAFLVMLCYVTFGHCDEYNCEMVTRARAREYVLCVCFMCAL